MSDGGEIFTDQYSTDATFSALAPAPLPSAPWLPLPSSPQWLSDLVTATEEWAAQVIRNNPPPCAHQYCREHGCGLCFGVPGAMADMILARPYASGDNPASPPADGWQPIGTIAGDGPALISGRDMLLAAGYTFDESLSTLAVSVQPEPEPADIVDRIDELVNDQLANYGNRSGYDHNVNQDLCPHCGREWHGLKITARIEQMRSRGRYDEDYRYADDDSEVICEGSEFIGPMKYGPPTGSRTAVWIDIRAQIQPIDISAWFGTSQDRWWRIPIPSDVWRVTNRVDEATVQIGAQEIVVNDARVDFNNGHIDVRCTLPPGFGGTWEPITAPGVLQHPDRSRQ